MEVSKPALTYQIQSRLVNFLTHVYRSETDTWRRQRKFFHFAQLQSHASNPHYIAALNQHVRRTIDELLAAYSTTPQSTTKAPSTDIPNLDLKTHWHHILEAYICGVVSQLAYGYQVQSSTEKYVRDWVEFYNEFEKAAEPARYAVNAFPWLRFIPSWLGPWKRSGKEYLGREREMIHRMFSGVGQRMGSAVAVERGTKGVGVVAEDARLDDNSEAGKQEEKEPWSIANLYFLDPLKWTTGSSATNLTPNEAAYTLGAFIEASMAGTPAALKLFFQAMLWYPEWQDRIYEEICKVCGSVSPLERHSLGRSRSRSRSKSKSKTGEGDGDEKATGNIIETRSEGERRSSGSKPRMPELRDTPHLPIIRAVIKEMLRWRPTLPGGFPHRLTRDDLYTPPSASPPSQNFPNPYILKANSLLLWHHYTLTRSSPPYLHPETFNPIRFLNAGPHPQTTKMPLTKYPTCDFDPAFGFGRRMCPGTRMAEDMMVLFVARIVSVCVVARKGKGRAGEGKEEGGGKAETGKEDVLGDFEEVPWDEYDEGRPTRPMGFEFVLVERVGWRGRVEP